MDGGATTQEAIRAFAEHSGETLGEGQRRGRALREAVAPDGESLDLWIGAPRPGGGRNAAKPAARHLVNLALSYASERPADMPGLVARMREWAPGSASVVRSWEAPVIPNALLALPEGDRKQDFGTETRSHRFMTDALTNLRMGSYFEEMITGAAPHKIPGLGVAVPDRLVVDADLGVALLYFHIAVEGAKNAYVLTQSFLAADGQRRPVAPGRVERTAAIPASFFILAAELLAPRAAGGKPPFPSSSDPVANGIEEDGDDGVSSAEAHGPETKNGANGAPGRAFAAPSNTGVQPRANGTRYSHSAENREREENSQSLFSRGWLDTPRNLSRHRRLGAQPHVLAAP